MKKQYKKAIMLKSNQLSVELRINENTMTIKLIKTKNDC